MEDFQPILNSLGNTFGALEAPDETTAVFVSIEGGREWTVDTIGYDSDGIMLHAFDWIEFTEENVNKVLEEYDIEADDEAEVQEVIGETVLMQRGLIPLDRVISIEADIPEELSDNTTNIRL